MSQPQDFPVEAALPGKQKYPHPDFIRIWWEKGPTLMPNSDSVFKKSPGVMTVIIQEIIQEIPHLWE